MAKVIPEIDSFKSRSTNNTQDKPKKYLTYIEKEVANPSVSVSSKDYKRINMAFTDNNYATIQSETNRMGINLTFFVNTLVRIIDKADIDKYIEAQPIKRTKDNVARRKGNPAKRINLKFPMDTYEKIVAGAEQYNQTITQYMNIIVEVYAQDMYN